MTHQTLSLEKYWKLFPATLNLYMYVAKISQNTMAELHKELVPTCQRTDQTDGNDDSDPGLGTLVEIHQRHT